MCACARKGACVCASVCARACEHVRVLCPCLSSHVLPSPPLPSPPHPRLPYPENVLEERYVNLDIQCNALAQAMPLHSRTCAHARVHTHPPSLTCPATHVSAQHHEASNAAAHSCTLLHMLPCRGLRMRPRTIAHMHAIHTHKLTQAHPHTHTHATIRSFTRTHRQTDRQPISR